MTSTLEPFDNLQSNVNEVRRLYWIHRNLSGGTRGRKRDVEVLNKSGITLLVASWEAFIEDLAKAAFDHMLTHTASPSIFPNRVLVAALKDLREDQDVRKLWKLAGDGWRTVLQDHRDNILDRYIGKLNTPRPSQVNNLFENLVGLTSLSKCWRWKKCSCDAACTRLDELITLRGEIAHRAVASKAVHMKHLIDGALLIQRLAVKSSNHVRDYLKSKTNVSPWSIVAYRGFT